MANFGPWLFATAVFVVFGYIFVHVPNARKWIGYSIVSIIGTFAFTLAFILFNLWKTEHGPWENYAPVVGLEKSQNSIVEFRKYTSLGIGWREATEEEMKNGYQPQVGLQQLEIAGRKLFVELTFNALSETDKKNTVKEMIVAMGITP